MRLYVPLVFKMSSLLVTLQGKHYFLAMFLKSFLMKFYSLFIIDSFDRVLHNLIEEKEGHLEPTKSGS